MIINHWLLVIFSCIFPSLHPVSLLSSRLKNRKIGLSFISVRI
ncbi:hypothetical protein HMPREF1551_00787 [Capnocytophaga sp. oral taxon 863 str. F0517]|nr:hypothetical protein HMPREF1551_00787 [Capnocytophaga sp. oral taxon 863 str. F0517]